MCQSYRVISAEMAMKLSRAGLDWMPREGDKFVIPGRNLDGNVFTVSEMTIEARPVRGGTRISFNGAVEWALDSIMQSDVVWLPSEAQLRDRLGATFRQLRSSGSDYVCVADFGEGEAEFKASNPSDAYAAALLDLINHPELRVEAIVEGD